MRTTRGRHIRTALVLGLVAGAASAGADRSGSAPESEAAVPLRLTLNTAAYRLYVYENGERTHSYRVAVGKPGHRTPTGSYRISRVIWNPWWHPPESDWAKDAEPVAPGPGNPMGRVKIQFEGLYYIHGTSDPNSLMRTVSHGCVRMANRDAIELARLIHRHGSPELPSSELDRLEADPEATRWITLDAPIPFQVEYRLVEIRAGILEVHPDIYDLARIPLRERIIEALQREGHDTARLDPERLEAFARRGSRAPPRSRSAPCSGPNGRRGSGHPNDPKRNGAAPTPCRPRP